MKRNNNIFLFEKENWRLVFIGIALIIIGFLLMMGGKTENPNIFNADELYSFRRITLAPIFILIGFVLQGYAILKKPTERAAVNNEESTTKTVKEDVKIDNLEATSKTKKNKKKKKKFKN